MKLFIPMITLIITTLSFGQEVIHTTRSSWVGGPSGIHGIKWSTSIHVPKNSSVELIAAHTKEFGWADVSLIRTSDSTVTLTGDYQFDDNVFIDNKEIESFKENKSEIEYNGVLYWQIKTDGQYKAIVIESFENLILTNHP
jgi:hypothetical protein